MIAALIEATHSLMEIDESAFSSVIQLESTMTMPLRVPVATSWSATTEYGWNMMESIILQQERFSKKVMEPFLSTAQFLLRRFIVAFFLKQKHTQQ
jgi:hypothetical protein